MRVVRVDKNEWKALAERAHLIVFGEKMVADEDRIDFTLVLEGEADHLMGYVTCREFDAKSLYWQYGGAFPGTKSTSLSYPGYTMLTRWCEGRYDRILTMVENTNCVMLKMHLRNGFKICGFRMHHGKGLVELMKEFVK